MDIYTILNRATKADLINILANVGINVNTKLPKSEIIYTIIDYANISEANYNYIVDMIYNINELLAERKASFGQKMNEGKVLEAERKEYLSELQEGDIIPINIMENKKNGNTVDTTYAKVIKLKNRELYIQMLENVEEGNEVKDNNLVVYEGQYVILNAESFSSRFANVINMKYKLQFNVDEWINDVQIADEIPKYLEEYNIIHPGNIVSEYVV